MSRNILLFFGKNINQMKFQQAGSVPFNAPMMIVVAQPTPASTKRASSGQFMAQAPHSIQASRFTILAFLFSIVNTPCGHTFSHSFHKLTSHTAKVLRTTRLGGYHLPSRFQSAMLKSFAH